MDQSVPELDQLADELYAVRPDDFAEARDAQIKKARADGKAALARELAKLRKPTLSAWLINLLWRDQREVMEQLFELADALGQAQADASGPALRELTSQRRQLEAGMVRQAEALARAQGVSVTDSVVREAQETLGAALADPSVAEEVRSGRLVKPASYAGFGVLSGRPAAPAPAPKRATESPAEPIDLASAQKAREARERAERRQIAERRVREARAAVDHAARALALQTRVADETHRREADLQQRLEDLREQVRRAEAEVESTLEAASAADRDRAQAEEAHAAAEKELEQAQRALDALS